jgi:hypothetical protein
MYPFVMKSFRHPVGKFEVKRDITPYTDFITFEGTQQNTLPTRIIGVNGGLNFTISNGTFHTTIHEFNLGIELGTIKPNRILHTYQSKDKTNFEPFVEKFWTLRKVAQQEGNEAMSYVYKIILNSAYGKFAMNPEEYEDYEIVENVDGVPDARLWPQDDKQASGKGRWHLHTILGPDYHLISRDAVRRDEAGSIVGMTGRYLNVGTAASITGAARAVLTRAALNSTGWIYCDTDSIICETLDPSCTIASKMLGAWKLEAECDRVAIVGKKTYACFRDGIAVKHASKGVDASPEQIALIATGQTLVFNRDFPLIGMDGKQSWPRGRRIRVTA